MSDVNNHKQNLESDRIKDFPPVERWPEIWQKGRAKCLPYETNFMPEVVFEDFNIPERELKNWAKLGLATDFDFVSSGGLSHITCLVMGFTSFGKPTWFSYRTPWFELEDEEDEQTILEWFLN